MLPNLSRLDKHASQPTAGNTAEEDTTPQELISLMENNMCTETELNYHIIFGTGPTGMQLAITSDNTNALEAIENYPNVGHILFDAVAFALDNMRDELPIDVSEWMAAGNWLDRMLRPVGGPPIAECMPAVIRMTRTEPMNAFDAYSGQHPRHIHLYQHLRQYVDLVGTDVLFIALHPYLSSQLMNYIAWLQSQDTINGYNSVAGMVMLRGQQLQAIYDNWPQRVADLDRSDPQARARWNSTWALRNISRSESANWMLQTFIGTDDFLHVFVFSNIVNALAGMLGDPRPPSRPTLIPLPTAITAYPLRGPIEFGRRRFILFCNPPVPVQQVQSLSLH